MFEQRYRNELEQEIRSGQFHDVFEDLKKNHKIFRLYPTVASLCNLMHPGNKNYAHKDEVLNILLNDLHRDNTVYPLLNLMFGDSLYFLYREKRKHAMDSEELFSRIQWDFYHTVITHDLEQRPKKIDVNIVLDTRKRVTEWEAENIQYQKRHKNIDNINETDISLLDLRKDSVNPEEMEEYLLEMVYRKVITDIQFDLIVETRIYGRMTQEEWAAKQGISHVNARQLKLRAERAIRKYEQNRLQTGK